MIPAIANMIASGGAASAGDAAGGASGNASSGGENNSQFAETFAAVRNTQSAPAEADARATVAAPAAEDPTAGEAVVNAMQFVKDTLGALPGDMANEGDALMAAFENQLDPEQSSPDDDVPDLIGLLLSASGAVEVQAASNDNPVQAQDVPDEVTDAVELSLLALLLNQAQPVQNGAEALAGDSGDDLLVQGVQATQNTTPVPQGSGIPAANELLEALKNAAAVTPVAEPIVEEGAVASAPAPITSQEAAAKQLDALLAASQIKNTPASVEAKNIAPELTQAAVVPLRRPETQNNNVTDGESAVLPLPTEGEEKGGTVITDRLADFLKDLKLPQEKPTAAHKEAVATQTKAAATTTASTGAADAGSQAQASNVVSLGVATQSPADGVVTPRGDASRDKASVPALQGDAAAPVTTPPASEVKPQASAPDVQFHKLVQASSVSQDKVVDQVKVQIQNMAQQGVDRINIQMQPPELGRVHVRLDISPDGHTTGITITASNQSTLDLLQRDSRDLAKALQGSGLSMEAGDMQFNLQHQNPQGGGFFGQNDNSSSATPFPLDANGEVVETANDGVEVMAGEYLLTLAGGLDIRV